MLNENNAYTSKFSLRKWVLVSIFVLTGAIMVAAYSGYSFGKSLALAENRADNSADKNGK